MTHQAQDGASKLGRTMKAMDRGAMEMGEYTSTSDGFKVGILPSSESSNGVPFKSINWL